ncbi:sensor histidine kinase [Streptomyces sp. NPDC001594]|uniref:sensor histidine kinase n=1 Tax=Streptomyces sp. NPDC001594 TaxID=3364590 RepID=UPI0036C99C14
MTASPSPLRPSALALVVTAVAAGTISAAAVAAAPTGVRAPLGWFAAFGTLLLALAAFTVTWCARTTRQLRGSLALLGGEVATRDAYIARLTADAARETADLSAELARLTADHTARVARLTAEHTAETDRLTAAHTADAARLAAAHTTELDHLAAAQQATRERLGEELRRAQSGRAAAMAAAANAAGRMQALATGMLADLREMEHKHADEEVLGDLLHLDHRTAQAGRLADSIAVLTGARSGRRWAKPIVMESILRGAMGRIGGYQRVRLHSTSTAAVAGHAAEGVMHALAELLDNAANFSPPTAEVHVYVEEVPAGIVITVEDSGLVMSELQLRRAEQAVGAETLDLAGLSGTRLGLAVVGRLARKHGLTVSFRPSARGGTGALMRIPEELISHAPAEPVPAPALLAAPTGAADRAPAPAPAVPALAPAPRPVAGASRGGSDGSDGPDGPHDPEHSGRTPVLGESGLPQRRRGRTLAAAHPEGPDAASPAPRTQGAPTGASRSAARFGSFRQAVRDAPARQQPTNPPHPEGDTR